MKTILLLIMMLCSICNGQIRAPQEKTDFSPLFRLVVPVITSIIVYKAFDDNDMDLPEQFKILLISMASSIGTSVLYETLDGRDFKLQNISEYGLGMGVGASVVLLFEF